MNNTPSREQIAYAYGRFLAMRGGDKASAMIDVSTFVLGYSDPPPGDATHPEMRLDTEAMVGKTIFSKGMPWYVVVQRAAQEYANRGAPEPTDVQIAEFRTMIENMLLPPQPTV